MTRAPIMVEAPAGMADYDSVQIRVSLTPVKGVGVYNEKQAADSVHSVVWVAAIEARDMRCLEYMTRKLVDQLMREWHSPEPR